MSTIDSQNLTHLTLGRYSLDEWVALNNLQQVYKEIKIHAEMCAGADEDAQESIARYAMMSLRQEMQERCEKSS